MASNIIEQIAEMMLRQGDIEAQRRREELAMLNEKQEQKWFNRPLRNTLKAVAQFAPLFLPGGPFVSTGLSYLGNNRGVGPDEDRYREYYG